MTIIRVKDLIEALAPHDHDVLVGTQGVDGNVNIGVFLELGTIRVIASETEGLFQDGDYVTLVIT